MPQINLLGVPVDFPFDPYDCQVTYMEKVIECLETSNNALLESPTGTGKTLCLLCSALAWQLRAKTLSQLSSGLEGSGIAQHHTIFYASRTHSQLSQVVKELKNTVYKPTISILGSREQLCVNEEVKRLGGSLQNHACGELTKNRSCRFKNNLEDVSRGGGNSEAAPIMDIEDLVAHGKMEKVCPYYLSRDAMATADLVLLPYNYLLDPLYRKAVKAPWRDAVVIFDEAHNVEQVAADAASFELSSLDVAGALAELDRCLRLALQPGYAPEEGSGLPEGGRLAKMKEILLKVEECLEAVPIAAAAAGGGGGGAGGEGGTSRPGTQVFEFFAQAELTFQTFEIFNAEMDKAISLLVSEGGATRSPYMEKIQKALRSVFRGNSFDECMAMAQHYKLHFKKFKISTNRDNFFGQKTQKMARSINYWCLCPGVAMEGLKSLGVRSIVLTSGTLSPLSSFALELRLPFKITLENPHVIDDSQISVLVAKKGPMGTALSSSFQNRSTSSYLNDLGAAVANVCRMVPRGGGVLVFFPSYSQLEAAVEAWQRGQFWAQIQRHKACVVEPRRGAELGAAIARHEGNLAGGHPGGSAFFAVCRGKVSEGIDFADHRARAVVITGIPFAPSQSPQIKLKKDYMDNCRLPEGASRLGGNDWYVQQAARAVNQALGRVVRHRRDYGAIILCDERFMRENIQSTLSRWIRPSVTGCDNFGQVCGRLAQFFKGVSENPTLQQHGNDTAQKKRTRPATGHLKIELEIPKELVGLNEEDPEESGPSSNIKLEIPQEMLGQEPMTYIDPALVKPANHRGWNERTDKAGAAWRRPPGPAAPPPAPLGLAAALRRAAERKGGGSGGEGGDGGSGGEGSGGGSGGGTGAEGGVRAKRGAPATGVGGTLPPPREVGALTLKERWLQSSRTGKENSQPVVKRTRAEEPDHTSPKKTLLTREEALLGHVDTQPDKPSKHISSFKALVGQNKNSASENVELGERKVVHRPEKQVGQSEHDLKSSQLQSQSSSQGSGSDQHFNSKETNLSIMKELKDVFGRDVYKTFKGFIKEVHTSKKEKSVQELDIWFKPMARKFIKSLPVDSAHHVIALRNFVSFFPVEFRSLLKKVIYRHIKSMPNSAELLSGAAKLSSIPQALCSSAQKGNGTVKAGRSVAVIRGGEQDDEEGDLHERSMNISLTQGTAMLRAVDNFTPIRGPGQQQGRRSSGVPVREHQMFSCNICLEVAQRPTSSHCKHICCFSCWKATLARTPSCPVCRKDVKLEELVGIKMSIKK